MTPIHLNRGGWCHFENLHGGGQLMFISGVPTQDRVHIRELCILDPKLNPFITLFRAITVFCGIDNILWNISHILSKCEEYSTRLTVKCIIFPHICMECEEYFVEYWQSRKTLLWLWIMLCLELFYKLIKRIEIKIWWLSPQSLWSQPHFIFTNYSISPVCFWSYFTLSFHYCFLRGWFLGPLF